MDFPIKFVKLYHDVLEAGGGVGGQTHQKSLKRVTKLKCIGFKVPKTALFESFGTILEKVSNFVIPHF